MITLLRLVQQTFSHICGAVSMTNQLVFHLHLKASQLTWWSFKQEKILTNTSHINMTPLPTSSRDIGLLQFWITLYPGGVSLD